MKHEDIRNHRPALAAAAALLAALAVAGCDRQDDHATVGAQVDAAIARTEQKAAELQAGASRDLGEAKVAARALANDAKKAVANAGEKAGERVNDALITSAVNAEIAKDSSLSALKIDVDTSNGRVALYGSAPNAAARERASTLAMAVKGVVSVDNRLSVAAPRML